MCICKGSRPSNRSPLFADEVDVMHDSPWEKSEKVRPKHEVGVVGDGRKAGGCRGSLHGKDETEAVGW